VYKDGSTSTFRNIYKSSQYTKSIRYFSDIIGTEKIKQVKIVNKKLRFEKQLILTQESNKFFYENFRVSSKVGDSNIYLSRWIFTSFLGFNKKQELFLQNSELVVFSTDNKTAKIFIVTNKFSKQIPIFKKELEINEGYFISMDQLQPFFRKKNQDPENCLWFDGSISLENMNKLLNFSKKDIVKKFLYSLENEEQTILNFDFYFSILSDFYNNQNLYNKNSFKFYAMYSDVTKTYLIKLMGSGKLNTRQNLISQGLGEYLSDLIIVGICCDPEFYEAFKKPIYKKVRNSLSLNNFSINKVQKRKMHRAEIISNLVSNFAEHLSSLRSSSSW